MLIEDVRDFRFDGKSAAAAYVDGRQVWFKKYPVGVEFNGGGTLLASLIPTVLLTLGRSGDGALSASARQQYVRAALLSGTGALSAAFKQIYTIPAPLSGGGTLSATVGKVVPTTLSGGGTLSATVHPWSPSDISGLAVWIDPAQDAVISYGESEKMFADAVPSTIDSGNYTLGVRFAPNVAGRITHIRGWCSGGTHNFILWDTATQTQLVNVPATFSAGAGALREVALPTPYEVVAGKSYTASVSSNGGQFAHHALSASLTDHLTVQGSYYWDGSDLFPGSASGNHYFNDVVYQERKGFTDGQRISSYTSHDPGGRVFTCPNAPAFLASSVGGKPRIKFDVARTDFAYTDGYNPGTAGLTFVMVAQTDGPSNYGMMWTWGQPATGMEMRYEDGSYRIQCIANYSGGGPVLSSAFTGSANTDYAFLLRQDTTNNKFRLYINDTLQFDGGTVALPNTADRLRLGYREDGYYYNGLIAEALVISGPISDTDRAKLMTYLRAKHGALPGV